jgi:succinate dehydrogenase flavin-adding protein (antitoxin of CptAB toxin-antitoxin module)
MIERVEKMHKRIEKAHKLLEKIVIALDRELVNYCIDEIDSDDERLDKMVNDILDFPDTLREYANEMCS